MNIEKTVIDYIDQYIPTYADVPIDKPDEFVIVERTGGGISDYVVEKPQIAIQCWSTTRLKAATLAEYVKEYMADITQLKDISGASLNSAYNFPAEKDEPRYQLTYDLVCRAF